MKIDNLEPFEKLMTRVDGLESIIRTMIYRMPIQEQPNFIFDLQMSWDYAVKNAPPSAKEKLDVTYEYAMNVAGANNYS